jgi:multisubunit Na+/H+ antiporter MnhF subunit
MNTAAFVLLSIAAFAFMYRILRGPTLPDRVVGVDGLRRLFARSHHRRAAC